MSAEEASAHAARVLQNPAGGHHRTTVDPDRHEAVGTGLKAAVSSFLFFAAGALIPVLPYLFGLSGMTAVLVAAVLVGATLLATGVIVGLLSGAAAATGVAAVDDRLRCGGRHLSAGSAGRRGTGVVRAVRV